MIFYVALAYAVRCRKQDVLDEISLYAEKYLTLKMEFNIKTPSRRLLLHMSPLQSRDF